MLAFIVLAGTAFAMNANTGQNINLYSDKDWSIGLGVQTGISNGETREFVYTFEYPDANLGRHRTLSELIWPKKDIYLAGGVLSAQYINRLFLNMGYWKKISSSTGKMQDRDWLDDISFEYPSHFSEHAAELENCKMWDINLAWTFYRWDGNTINSLLPWVPVESNVDFQLVAGYKHDELKWNSTGGYLNYWWGYYNEFEPEGEDAISYEYITKTPYLGGAINLTSGDLSLNVFGIFTSKMNIDTIDHHFHRDLLIKDKFTDADFWSIGTNLKWDFSKHWSLIGSYLYEKTKEVQGDGTYIDTANNAILLFHRNGKGFSNKAQTVSVSVAYRY